jgi:hypothetical protein
VPARTCTVSFTGHDGIRHSVNVQAETLYEAVVLAIRAFRGPIQFCMFLDALFGEERMEKLISSSVQQVKTLRANRRKSLGREPGLGEDSDQ